LARFDLGFFEVLIVHGWAERQRLLKAYGEMKPSCASSAMSYEKACRLVDEMRLLSERLGFRRDRGWFEAHRSIHANVRSALEALFKAKTKG